MPVLLLLTRHLAFYTMFIDTHAHLYVKEFDTDRTQVMERALAAGVHKIVLPNINRSSHTAMMQLVAQYPHTAFPALGIHPSDVAPDPSAQMEWLNSEIERFPYVAIGETGIDMYWDKTTLPQQQIAFRHQLQLAKKHKLPVIIHARDSFNEIFQVLQTEQSPELRGVFHCFTGTLAEAERAINFGFLLGIGGVATFKNSHLPQVLNQVPPDKLILETDAPYLAPVPHRGKRNESAYIPIIASRLADITGTALSRVAKQTTDNAAQLFGI